MPPPTTRLDQARHYAVITQYRAGQWLNLHSEATNSALRLILFGAKMLSLSWVCWPYSSRILVFGSLFVLASLDLWRPWPSRDAASRPGYNELIRVGTGHTHETTPTSRWIAGWQRSCMLLALHFLVLWVTARLGSLCAHSAVSDKWTDW